MIEMYFFQAQFQGPDNDNALAKHAIQKIQAAIIFRIYLPSFIIKEFFPYVVQNFSFRSLLQT